MVFGGLILVVSALLGPAAYQQQFSVPPVDITPHDGPQIRYIEGVWTRPTQEQMMAFYPLVALKERIGGKVSIDCAIAPNGTLASCDVVSESPEGYGFGHATVAAFLKYAHVKLESVWGDLQPADRHRFTYNWIPQ